MATYINYGEGEEDAVVQGAEWLRAIITQSQGPEGEEKFTEQFKAIHNEDTAFNACSIFNLFVDYSDELFKSIADGSRGEERAKELESFYALVLHFLTLLDEEDHLTAATNRLCDIFSSDLTQPDLRLRLLMMLYNTFQATPTAEQRHKVFTCILDYSARAGLFDQVLPYLEHLEAWMADWEGFLTVEDKRAIYCDVSKYTRELKKSTDAFEYLKKYHLLLQGEKKVVLEKSDVQKMTDQLLKDAITLPSVIQFDDILAYDSVKASKSDLVKLCEIFLSGTVNDLRDFQGKKQKVFDDHDLNFQDCMSKIRLLTLATLAHGRSEMSLSEVAKALEEKEDSVEPWVVRAISEGVIDGRIDQFNAKVLVKSAFQRKFEKEEWAFLDSKLTSWIDNLESVIKFIGEQKTLKEVA